jgi:hypothetical protein
MKRIILISVVSTLSVSTFAFVAFANNNIISHPNSSVKYNENPAPIYTANDKIDVNSFISEEEIIENIRQTKDSQIISKELKTWGNYVKDEKEEGTNYQIDPNSMVRVIKIKYPEGLATKAGFYKNAVSIDVFDAETGNLIESTVTGDYQGRARK